VAVTIEKATTIDRTVCCSN